LHTQNTKNKAEQERAEDFCVHDEIDTSGTTTIVALNVVFSLVRRNTKNVPGYKTISIAQVATNGPIVCLLERVHTA
jgi:hypothetical protein